MNAATIEKAVFSIHYHYPWITSTQTRPIFEWAPKKTKKKPKKALKIVPAFISRRIRMKKEQKNASFKTGDRLFVKQGESAFEGTVLPETKKGFLDLKLKNGYNISLDLSKKTEIKRLETPKKTVAEPKPLPFNPSLPSILILHTGGTIASRVNYETGGVFAAFTPEDLLAMFPELTQKANFETKMIGNMESENMRLSHYTRIAEEIKKTDSKKISGIIVSHGTDTLAYTSAALAFMVQKPGIPVLLVGAQRSSDRGSSDAAMNLSCATDFITKTDFCGVAICMHENENDSNCVLLPPAKTRKLHTSRRDAFRAVNAQPVARVEYKTGKTEFFEKNYPKKGNLTQTVFKTKLEEKVGLLKASPTLIPEQIKVFEKQKFKGLILEGTGLGHFPVISRDSKDKTNDQNLKALESLIKKGCVVGMVSQCIFGSTQMHVYSAGPLLTRLGVLEGKDMLVETALVKMAWLLANYPKKEAEKLFGQNLIGEINERTVLQNQAPKFQ